MGRKSTALKPANLLELFWSDYVPLRLSGRSAASIHQHLVTLRHFSEFLGREPQPGDLENLTVARFLAYLADGRSPMTANKSLDKLLAQWRFLQQHGKVHTFPDIRKLPEPEVVPKAWLPHEWRKLLEACRQTPGYIGGVKAGDWWLSLHLLLYDTAERISAVLSLHWNDIDLTTRWLSIPPDVRKGKTRGKMHRLHADTIKQLRRIREPHRDKILPWPKDKTLLWPEYDVLLLRAGLPHDRKSKFHRVRKTVASFYKAAGGDATELLDHSDRKVTKTYLDPRIVQAPQAADLLPKMRR